jgi:antitoxin (DNA-binding transcriptional repressor) of toxin-antitoxin stability system
VRELRQNLSVYLERVKRGEALTVTDHGEAVAILRPLPRNLSVVERLVAEGRATPATRSLNDLPRPRPATTGTRPLSDIVDDLRAERLP